MVLLQVVEPIIIDITKMKEAGIDLMIVRVSILGGGQDRTLNMNMNQFQICIRKMIG